VQLQFRRWGVPPCSLVRPLDGQWGRSALASLKEAHTDMVLTPLLPDEAAWEPHALWSARPYGHFAYFADTLPGDESVWLACSAPALSRALERDPDGTYSFTTAYEQSLDFAQGRTTSSGAPANDIDAMAYRAVSGLVRGIEAGFPGVMITHESNLAAMSQDDLRRLLHQIDRMLIGRDAVHTSLSQAMRQLRDKANCKITAAQLTDGQIAVELSGRTQTPIQMCVLEDDGPAVRAQWQTIDPFDGTTHVRP
jgi:hypothetical protein